MRQSSAAHPAWPAARNVHLLGGARAFNGLDPQVVFTPSVQPGGAFAITLAHYHSIHSRLGELGVTAIGFDFITSSEAEGLLPTNWRPFLPLGGNVLWPCNDQVAAWAHIAHAAYEANDPRLWDLARRLSHQLRVCAWRLREVSEAYHRQLVARCERRAFGPGERFQDGFTWFVFLAMQGFLVDACILRDYLAEFFALYCCERDARGEAITSMAQLKKKVLSNAVTDALAGDLRSATDDGGWLHRLGAYRDLVVHCAPLERAGAKILARTSDMRLGDSHMLPAVSLALPDDPAQIRRARVAGESFSDMELSFLAKASRGDAPGTDCLMYAYQSLNRLTRLVSDFASRSPLAPKPRHLTDADLAGPIEVIKQ
jgi:hypothetical protein